MALDQQRPPNEKRIEIKSSPAPDRWIGQDKVLHLLGSIILTSMGTWGHENVHGYRNQAVRFGMGFSVTAGLIKEWFDGQSTSNRFSWKDMAVNCIGTLMAGLILARWVD